MNSLAAAPRRELAARVVVVVAAAACLATQAPRWSMDAKLTQTSAPPGKALVVTVEASQEPSVSARTGSDEIWEDAATPRTTWTGKADFVVDDGAELHRVNLEGQCTKGGGLCSSCDPPAAAFVRVASAREVDAWAATHDAPVVAATPDKPIGVEVEATRPPVVRFGPAGSKPATSCRMDKRITAPTASSPGQWSFLCWTTGAAGGAWVAEARIRGLCSAAPCAPPAAEKVSITSAKARP